MLPPLPRCSGWAYSSLISPSRVSLPRKGHRVGLHIVLFEACSAFTRVAACTLARSPYFVTRYPKASDISSPPCLLRLLPAGAVAGWDLHPLESAAFSRRTPEADVTLPAPSWHLSFMLGLSHGFGIESLAIQYGNGPAPLDYRDFITNSTFRGETERHVETYCADTLVWNQTGTSRNRR